LVAVSL
jgi:hypothetical protein